MQLSIALQGIVTQQLLPTADGIGRVVACEVLVPTPAIRNLIREGKTHQIYSALQTSGAVGMQTMDATSRGSSRQGKITAAAGRAARLGARGAEAAARRRRAAQAARRRAIAGAAAHRPSGAPATPGRSRRGDEHLRLPRRRRRRRPVARARSRPSSKAQVTEQLRQRGLIVLDVCEKREPFKLERLLPALQERQHARAGGLLAPVRDPDRLGDADAALALHARGADRGRDAQARRSPALRAGRRGRQLAGRRRWSATRRSSTRSTASMVRAGEGSGRLEEALDRVAFQLEKLDALRRQVKSAMMYPAVVFTLRGRSC